MGTSAGASAKASGQTADPGAKRQSRILIATSCIFRQSSPPSAALHRWHHQRQLGPTLAPACNQTQHGFPYWSHRSCRTRWRTLAACSPCCTGRGCAPQENLQTAGSLRARGLLCPGHVASASWDGPPKTRPLLTWAGQVARSTRGSSRGSAHRRASSYVKDHIGG